MFGGIDFDLLTNAIEADSPEEKCFVKYCKSVGIPSDFLHTFLVPVNIPNTCYEIIGLKKNGRLFQVACKKVRKTSENIVVLDSLNHYSPVFYLDVRKIINKKYYTHYYSLPEESEYMTITEE